MPADEQNKMELEVITESTQLLDPLSPMTEDTFRKNHDFTPAEAEPLWRKISKKVRFTKTCFFGMIPILLWLPRYDFKNNFFADLVGGITVSVLQIPHGLAFAPLGGQEPVVGLYMAVFPVMIYFVFGTSRHISLGMMAILIMMVGKVVEIHSITEEQIRNGTEGYSALQVGIACTFTVGLWQILLASLQLGSLCVLLSASLINGFTSGASIHIIFIQVKHIFGIKYSMTQGPLKLVYACIAVFQNIAHTNFVVLGVSCSFMVVLYAFNEFAKPRIAKKCKIPIPMEFIMIGIGILVSELLNLKENYDVPVVGTVPGGLPNVVTPPFALMPTIAIDCLAIALVNISINISLAKIFAKKGGYTVYQNQELMAYGLSNMFGGFFQSLPVTASLSRSMVQYSVGSKTEMAHAVSFLSVLFMLLFFGPIFENVPLGVLAAIVIVTVKGLFMQLTEFPSIWRKCKYDGIVWLVTFTCVVLIDIDYGIGIGLIASIVTLVLRNIETRVLVLKPFQHRFLDSRRYQVKETKSKVLILKIIGGINFFNSSLVLEKIISHIDEFSSRSQDKITIVFDFSAVPYVDPSGVKDFVGLYSSYKKMGCDLVFAQCSDNVYQNFESCDVFATLPKHLFIVSIEAALTYLHDKKFT